MTELLFVQPYEFCKGTGASFSFLLPNLGKINLGSAKPWVRVGFSIYFWHHGAAKCWEINPDRVGWYSSFFNVMGHPNLKRPTQTQPNPWRGLIFSAIRQPNLGKNSPDPAKTCRASGSYIVGNLRNGDVLALVCGISLAFIVAL